MKWLLHQSLDPLRNAMSRDDRACVLNDVKGTRHGDGTMADVNLMTRPRPTMSPPPQTEFSKYPETVGMLTYIPCA